MGELFSILFRLRIDCNGSSPSVSILRAKVMPKVALVEGQISPNGEILASLCYLLATNADKLEEKLETYEILMSQTVFATSSWRKAFLKRLTTEKVPVGLDPSVKMFLASDAMGTILVEHAKQFASNNELNISVPLADDLLSIAFNHGNIL